MVENKDAETLWTLSRLESEVWTHILFERCYCHIVLWLMWYNIKILMTLLIHFLNSILCLSTFRFSTVLFVWRLSGFENSYWILIHPYFVPQTPYGNFDSEFDNLTKGRMQGCLLFITKDNLDKVYEGCPKRKAHINRNRPELKHSVNTKQHFLWQPECICMWRHYKDGCHHRT